MDILNQLNLESFAPPSLITHPLAQTIIPYYLPIKSPPPSSERHIVDLPDGDKLALSISKPQQWMAGSSVVILIHGLAGCENSSYLVRMILKLYNEGYLCVRLNLRSCGPGQGIAQWPYHSGRSEDTREVLNWINKKYPHSPITQVGFSLSANITLKMLGECDELINPALDSAIAISPPLDLGMSAKKMTKDYFKVFNYFFLQQLREHAKKIENNFPSTPKTIWPKRMDLIDFDHLYTAPRSGFAGAYDYYQKSSSLQFIESIKRKTLILVSQDDPVVDTSGLSSLIMPENVQSIETRTGGHVGFLERGRFWADELIKRWIIKLDTP